MSVDEIIEKYPRLFPDGHPRCGFHIGAGWLPIVDKLFSDILSLCRSKCIRVPEVTQVKEKFGTLRIYVSTNSPAIREMIDEVEAITYEICEDCGAPGRLRGEGWARTLCDKCST
jgi:hypothetical protein